MPAVVTAITTGFGSTEVFAAVTSVAPLVVTGLVVGIGLHLLRRALRGVGKGKATI